MKSVCGADAYTSRGGCSLLAAIGSCDEESERVGMRIACESGFLTALVLARARCAGASR